jgi:hypothetical protein
MRGWRGWLVAIAEGFGFMFCLIAGYILLVMMDAIL